MADSLSHRFWPRLRRLCQLACLLPGCAMPVLASSAPVLYVNDVAPFAYLVDGKPAGLVCDLLAQLAARSGAPAPVELLPFKRLSAQMHATPNAFGGVWRQPENEVNYTWITRLFVENMMLVARSDSSVDVSSPEAARHMRVGVLLGSPAEAIARRRGFTHIDTARTAAGTAQKLKMGRIDVWIAVPSVVAAGLAQIGEAPAHVRYGAAIEEVAMYVACAHDCDGADIRRWKAAAQAMRQDGSFGRIVHKYQGATAP